MHTFLNRAKQRKELIIFLLILLAATAAIISTSVMPTLSGQLSTKRWFLRQNLRMVKQAVNAYVQRHDGSLPESISQAQEYFPGGPAIDMSAPHGERQIPKGTAPINPFTYAPEWPTTVNCKTKVEAERVLNEPLAKGAIRYIRVDSPSDYYVVGGDFDSSPIRGN